MAAPVRAEDIGQLIHALLQPTALIELGVIAACLAVAWLVVRLVRGPEPRRGSMWFGKGVVDGIFFPVLALLLVLLARWGLQGVVPEAVFRLAVPIFVSLAVIRLTVRVLRASFPDSHLVRVVERSLSWVVWLGVVLWVTGVLPLVLQELDAIQWKIGATQVSVRNILEGLVSAVLVLVGALWLSSLLEARLLSGSIGNVGVRKMAANALRALLLFIGLMFALSAAGIDLTALGVLGGALGVGIGFGLQKLAANYVSGFVILAEQSMRIGDLVRVDNFEGRITDISTRYTVVRAINGRESIIPNEMMITQRVENASLADSRMLLNTVVQVAYGSDVPAVMARMQEAVAAVPRVMADPGPGVLLTNFAADGLELTVGFWIADPENGQGNVRSDVNLAILRLLDEMAVEIPYPQRVLRRASA
ncbi:mechanosensitive ion channel protein [beta proteobacterium AAP51]|nr:mechanosensitive ion channel protein [beta proteobacterium AAP51]